MLGKEEGKKENIRLFLYVSSIYAGDHVRIFSIDSCNTYSSAKRWGADALEIETEHCDIEILYASFDASESQRVFVSTISKRSTE